MKGGERHVGLATDNADETMIGCKPRRTSRGLSGETAEPMLGTVIAGRYRIVELIADGGMCSVYRAEDRERQRPIALKVLSSERATQPDLAARFHREALVGKRLADPHVASVLDSGSL